MILQRFKKAQSVTEYAILLGLAIAAFAGMQLYIKRGLQGKLKDSTTLVTRDAVGNFTAQDGSNNTRTLSLGNTSQYEPYYTQSNMDSVQSSESQDTVGPGASRTVASTEASARTGYSAEKTANATNMQTHDANWQ